MNDTPAPRSRKTFLRRNSNTFFWIVLGLVALIYMMPIVKGMVYRAGLIEAGPTVDWRTDFDAALEEASQSNKLVMLDFTASWCPPCHVMKHEVWPDEDVRRTVEASFVPVLLDIDLPNAGRIAAHYGVRSIPTIIIVDASGKELQRVQTTSASQMVAFLGKAAPVSETVVP